MQIVAGALVAAMLLLAGVVIAFRDGGDDKTLNATNSSTTSTTESNDIIVSPSSTTSTTLLGITTTTGKGSSATTAPSTTTTTAKPIETADLDCVKTTPAQPTPVDDNWSEYWTTKPQANQALQLQVCVDDTTPKVGQLVNISVIAYDPDRQVGTGSCDIRVTWTGSPKSCRTTTVIEDGAQPTPSPDVACDKNGKPDGCSKAVKITFTHTYNDAGDQTIDVAAWSGKDDQKRNPYKSYASISRQITVHK